MFIQIQFRILFHFIFKRKKVEINRAKRKSKISNSDMDEIKIKRESDQGRLNDFWANDSTIDPAQLDMSPGSVNSECASGYHSVASTSTLSNCSMSPTSSTFGQYPTQILQQKTELPFPPVEPSTVAVNAANSTLGSAVSILNSVSSSTTAAVATAASTSTATATAPPTVQYQMQGNQQSPRLEYPTKDSNTTEIVNFFLNHPSESSNYINHLMPNQKSAMEIMTKVIHSQKDAMKMIGHLIGSPGDALKIIAKIMNSPYQALTVFTKFMSSPNDALEIIAKCVNSPANVLHFLQQLMSTPDNAVDIVNRFLNEPAEAMKMLNELVDISMVDSTTKLDCNDLNNLMAPPPPSSDPSSTSIRSSEFLPNDIVNDTLFHMKSVSSPTVRHLLEAEHGSPSSKTNDFKASPHEQPIAAENRHTDDAGDTDGADDGGGGGAIDENENPNTLESLISNLIKIEYNCRESSISRELNDSETAKLNELIVAYKALFVPLDEDLSPIVKQRTDLTMKVNSMCF